MTLFIAPPPPQHITGLSTSLGVERRTVTKRMWRKNLWLRFSFFFSLPLPISSFCRCTTLVGWGGGWKQTRSSEREVRAGWTSPPSFLHRSTTMALPSKPLCKHEREKREEPPRRWRSSNKTTRSVVKTPLPSFLPSFLSSSLVPAPLQLEKEREIRGGGSHPKISFPFFSRATEDVAF